MANNGDWIDITAKQTEEVGRQALDYAYYRWSMKMRKLAPSYTGIRQSYNMEVSSDMTAPIDTAYGTPNRVKYIDYGITRNKVDTLIGEYLSRELELNVASLNKNALSKRIEKASLQKALYVAGDQVKQVREKYNAPVAGNIPIPESLDPATWGLNGKTKNEIVVQAAINDQIHRNNLKLKTAQDLQNMCFFSQCYGRVYIDENGDLQYKSIAPEDAMFEEYKDDIFMELSPYWGHRERMTYADILANFDLTAQEKIEIKNSFGAGVNTDIGMTLIDDVLCMDVFFLEWIALEPWRTKYEDDGQGGTRSTTISNDYYDKNEPKINNNVKNNKYAIETKYKRCLHEGVKLGHTDIYKNIGKKKNVIFKNDAPYAAVSSYTGVLFNTHDGKRISFYMTMEKVKHQYNWVRMLINQELSKFKGLQLLFDMAYTPTNKKGEPVKITKIIWEMHNYGILRVNSAMGGEFGNVAGRDVDLSKSFLDVKDYGFSNGFPMLLQVAVNLENLVDRLSAVNDDRQGLTMASATVTNTQNNIQTSRTITEPMFYSFEKFLERVGMRIGEYTKVAWTINPDKAASVIGDAALSFLHDTSELTNDDYTTYIQETRKHQQMRNTLQKYIETGINRGTLDVIHGYQAEMASTLSEAEAILDKARKDVVAASQASGQQQSASAAELQQKDQEFQLTLKDVDLRNELAVVQEKAKMDTVKQGQKDLGKQILTNTQQMHESSMAPPTTA